MNDVVTEMGGSTLFPVRLTTRAVPILTDEAGNVIGRTLHGQLLEGLMTAAEIEVQVRDGVRPKAINCLECGKIREVRPGRGAIPVRCRECSAARRRAQKRAETRNLMKDPEYRSRRNEARRARRSDPEYRERENEQLRRLRGNPEYRRRESERKNEKHRERMADPEYRERHNAARRERRAAKKSKVVSDMEQSQ